MEYIHPLADMYSGGLNFQADIVRGLKSAVTPLINPWFFLSFLIYKFLLGSWANQRTALYSVSFSI